MVRCAHKISHISYRFLSVMMFLQEFVKSSGHNASSRPSEDSVQLILKPCRIIFLGLQGE